MRRAALYICYDNITEPLVQTQVVAYLRELSRRDIEMHLLTFERQRHSLEKQRAISEYLDMSGIQWHALRYHQRPSLPATIYDIFVGTLTAMRICRKHRIQLVHARSHVPAAMAYMLKRILRCRFLFDLRGLLAEEYVDAANWTQGDLKFRLTKRMEHAFFRNADALVMLTHRIKHELVKKEPALHHRANSIHVIPCCVDVERFSIDREQRLAYRDKRGWTERRVLTYVGKLGTWYLAEEMARFFARARLRDSRLFFQVLTQSDPAPMQQALQANGVSSEDYEIRFARPDDLPILLAASDAGISFIRAAYSKRASSPTKLGEYFAAGLPIVANAGVGDIDEIVDAHRLGVIVHDYSDEGYDNAAIKLSTLLEDESAARRCREFAGQSLSLSKVGGPRYGAIYEYLFDTANSQSLLEAAEIG